MSNIQVKNTTLGGYHIELGFHADTGVLDVYISDPANNQKVIQLSAEKIPFGGDNGMVCRYKTIDPDTDDQEIYESLRGDPDLLVNVHADTEENGVKEVLMHEIPIIFSGTKFETSLFMREKIKDYYTVENPALAHLFDDKAEEWQSDGCVWIGDTFYVELDTAGDVA